MGGLLKYLSFNGRANRQRYWLTNLALFGLILLGILAVGALSAMAKILSILVIPLILVLLFAGFAVGARRLHDRNKSAWWLLLFQGVPLLFSALQGMAELGGAGAEAAGAAFALLSLPISIWAFVEMACLKGTTGPNRFGDDPLGSPLQEVFA
jgi:uncharacterized membrane protein YhaH (DUF805 family)